MKAPIENLHLACQRPPHQRAPLNLARPTLEKEATGITLGLAFVYVVRLKPRTIKTAERMEFGCYMDREGFLFDGSHFPDVTQRYSILG